MIATFAGQVTVLAYEVLVAARFGTGPDADALALALTVAFAAGNEMAGWVTALFVPRFLELRQRRGAAAAAAFVLRGGTALLIVTVALAAVLIAAAPSMLAVLAPGLVVEPGPARLLRLFAPVLVLLPASAWLAGILHSHGRFTVPGTRQALWYGTTLVLLLALGSGVRVDAVPAGMTAGLLLFCLLLWRSSARLVTVRGSGGSGPVLRPVAGALLPLALGSLVNYVNVGLERGIAARLAEGSLAALTYAFRLLNVPVNLFLLTAATMLLPALARSAAREDTAAFATLLHRAVRLAVVFTVPLAAVAAALAEPMIRVLFERGAFTMDSTRLTALALAWYAPAVVGMAAVHVLTRAYQALGEIPRLVGTGVAVTCVNMAMMPALTVLIGFRGLPLAATINWLLLFLALLLALRRRLGDFRVAGIVHTTARAGVAGVVAFACTAAAVGAGGGGLLAVVLAAAVGVAAYGLTLRAVGPVDLGLAVGLVLPGRQGAEARW